jgi:ornithine carbamoyltransferase
VLSRYLDAIMIRTFAQSDVEEPAQYASIPVINGLTDEAHPCQALADVMTIRERFERFEGLRVVYLGRRQQRLRVADGRLREARHGVRRRDAAQLRAGRGGHASGARGRRHGRADGRSAHGRGGRIRCPPAHYGEEITEGVLYGPQSAVWDEAENRLHAQEALMALVIR